MRIDKTSWEHFAPCQPHSISNGKVDVTAEPQQVDDEDDEDNHRFLSPHGQLKRLRSQNRHEGQNAD